MYQRGAVNTYGLLFDKLCQILSLVSAESEAHFKTS